MAHITDLKRDALQTALVSTVENIDDLEIAWLTSKGATSDQVNDAWVEVFALTLLGAATGNFHTDAFAYLGSLGHTQPDLIGRWFSFWSGVLP